MYIIAERGLNTRFIRSLTAPRHFQGVNQAIDAVRDGKAISVDIAGEFFVKYLRQHIQQG